MSDALSEWRIRLITVGLIKRERRIRQCAPLVATKNKKADSFAVGFLIFKRMTFTSLYPGYNRRCFRRDLVSITQIIAFQRLKFSSNS